MNETRITREASRGFVMTYADDQINRYDFNMNYSGYAIEYFPGFKRETTDLPLNSLGSWSAYVSTASG